MDVKFWDKLNDDEKLNLIAQLEEKCSDTEKLYLAEREVTENLRILVSNVTELYNRTIRYNTSGQRYEKTIRDYREKYGMDQKTCSSSDRIYKKDASGMWVNT